MGRELQKKKKRSSIPKVRMKPKSKRVNPLGNPIIAANWNQNETLTQNYRRLGLTSRLNTVTGGIEKRPSSLTNTSTSASANSKPSTAAALAISNAVPKTFTPTEARVERDPETGKIVRVIHEGKKRRENPLNDPLNSDSGSEDAQGEVEEGEEGQARKKNQIVEQLEAMAARGEAKKPRKQSEREREWIEALVGKYGEEYARMARDRRLNPMQQTEGDIRRRVEKWRSSGGAAAAGAGTGIGQETFVS